MDRLNGKIAIVTGGASGIGRATAMMLAAEGASVVIGDVDQAAADVTEDIRRGGGRATYVPADVTSWDDVRGLVATAVDQHGRLDVIVNNAAVAGPGPAGEGGGGGWGPGDDVKLSG